MARIWENFEKKDFIKDNDFPGQLIFEGDISEFCINHEENKLRINFGHGYIDISKNELIEALINICP